MYVLIGHIIDIVSTALIGEIIHSVITALIGHITDVVIIALIGHITDVVIIAVIGRITDIVIIAVTGHISTLHCEPKWHCVHSHVLENTLALCWLSVSYIMIVTMHYRSFFLPIYLIGTEQDSPS